MMTTHPRTLLTAASALAALALTACADQAPTSPLAAAPDQQAQFTTLLADPEINKTDTYLSANLTVERSATLSLAYPLYDPATGVMQSSMTYTAPPETQTVEAAYDYLDRVRVKVTRPADARDPETYVVDPARTIKTMATSYARYDASGAAIPVQYPDGAVTRSPLALIGSLVGEDITAGVLISYQGQDPTGPRPLSIQGGTAEFPDAETMRVTSAAGGETGFQGAGALLSARNGSVTRTYRRRGPKWVLAEVVLESRSARDGNEMTRRQAIRLSDVRWHENAAGNDRRRQQPGLGAGKGREPDANSTLETTYIERCPNITSLGNKTGVQSDCGPICPLGLGRDATIQGCPGPYEPPPPPPPPPAGANIVLQHGILSSGATWNRMDPWLSSDFYFSRKLVPSLSSIAGLGTQADQLTGTIEASGADNYILVGHSQGGLISRRVAQRRPDLARGVITIGTPHRGAALARNGRVALSSYLNNQLGMLYYGCRSAYDDPGCYIADFLRRTVYYYALDWALDQTVPASGDLQPGSPFITSVNSTPEYFTRVGIQSYANRRWVIARLAGDLGCNPENPVCGGRAWASYATWANDGFWTCSVVAGLLGYWNTSFWCGDIALAMYQFDNGWNNLTAPNGDHTDGIVQGTSQVYPSAVKQYPINNGDSHVGETSSDKVRPRLTDALSVQFGVPRRF